MHGEPPALAKAAGPPVLKVNERAAMCGEPPAAAETVVPRILETDEEVAGPPRPK